MPKDMIMARHDIDILAYKVDSFDSDSFLEDVVSYSSNSIVLVFNQKGVRVKYRPENCKIKDNALFFIRLKDPRLYYYLYPALFLIDYFKIFKLFLTICLRCRVRIIMVENTYAAVIAGIMKNLCFFKKMVYLPGDWLAGTKVKKGMLRYIGSNIVFPLFDYLACKLSDLTLNCTELISQARHDYWRRKITDKEMLFQVRLKVKSKETKPGIRNNIVFVGGARPESGLELAIRSLNKIRQRLDICLKIIGPPNTQSLFLHKVTRALGAGGYVNFLGFIEREDLNEALSDCFCGINLLTDKDSYTTKTLPAKIFDYFQHLLPVIVSNNIGWVADIVCGEGLGLVIDLDEDSFVKAVESIYTRQEEYQRNIVRYINNFKGVNLGELLIGI